MKRSVFLGHKLNYSEICREIVTFFSKHACNFEVCAQFQNSCIDITWLSWVRPATSITAEIVAVVEQFLMDNQLIKTNKISITLGILLFTSTCNIESLCAIGPQLLLAAHKEQRWRSCLNRLQWYAAENDEFLRHIISGYIAVLPLYHPSTTKRSTMEWLHKANTVSWKSHSHSVYQLGRCCLLRIRG